MKELRARSWIFQCNPQNYDLHRYLTENSEYIYWAASQHKDEIKTGDSVFIWRSTSADFPRGIIAFGVVCEEAKLKGGVDHPSAIRDDLWKKKSDRTNQVVGIKLYDFRLTLKDGMIPADLIQEDEVLSKMTIMRSWRQTNFALTDDEADIVKSLWGMVRYNDSLSEPELEEISFPEGKLKLVLHYRRERNPLLRNKALAIFKEKHNGKIFCEICSFSFENTYGELGAGYIEAHHIVPIAEMKEGEVTKISDLKMLCSNCHRMAHRDGGWQLLLKKFNISHFE